MSILKKWNSRSTSRRRKKAVEFGIWMVIIIALPDFFSNGFANANEIIGQLNGIVVIFLSASLFYLLVLIVNHEPESCDNFY